MKWWLLLAAALRGLAIVRMLRGEAKRARHARKGGRGLAGALVQMLDGDQPPDGERGADGGDGICWRGLAPGPLVACVENGLGRAEKEIRVVAGAVVDVEITAR